MNEFEEYSAAAGDENPLGTAAAGESVPDGDGTSAAEGSVTEDNSANGGTLKPPPYRPYDSTISTTELVRGKTDISTVAIIIIFVLLFAAIFAFCAYFILTGDKDSGDFPETAVSLETAPPVSETTEASGETGGQTAPAETMQGVLTIKDKPQLESVYYEADGVRMTTQGVAKYVGPSIVSVWIYEKGMTLSPYAQGSGIIISSDGYIVTNAHVLEGGDKIKVTLSDEREYEVRIIGSDAKTDIAVLKADGVDDFQAADLGNSDLLELGEPVVAIGSPDGMAGTVTTGVISGLNRQLYFEGQIDMNYIQTNAAINPGNSGGALVNMYGQVIGITSSKYADIDFEGMGFAIAMADAEPVISDLITTGYVRGRAKIGIQFREISEVTARMNDVVSGIYIAVISEDCDIAHSGLEVGDIITEINGKKVFDLESTRDAIKGMSPGDLCTAKVYRKSITGEVKWLDISFRLMEDNSVAG